MPQICQFVLVLDNGTFTQCPNWTPPEMMYCNHHREVMDEVDKLVEDFVKYIQKKADPNR